MSGKYRYSLNVRSFFLPPFSPYYTIFLFHHRDFSGSRNSVGNVHYGDPHFRY